MVFGQLDKHKKFEGSGLGFLEVSGNLFELSEFFCSLQEGRKPTEISTIKWSILKIDGNK